MANRNTTRTGSRIPLPPGMYPFPEFYAGNGEDSQSSDVDTGTPPYKQRGRLRLPKVVFDPNTSRMVEEEEPFLPPELTLASLAQNGQYKLEIGPNPMRAEQQGAPAAQMAQGGAVGTQAAGTLPPPLADSTQAAPQQATPRPLSPAEEGFNRANAAYQAAVNRDTKDRNGLLKSVLRSLAIGAKDMPMARNMGELAYGAARAVGTGIGGGIDKSFDERYDRDIEMGRTGTELDRATKTLQADSLVRNRDSMIADGGNKLSFQKEREGNRLQLARDRLDFDKDRAEQMFEIRQLIVDLRERGLDQTDQRIRLLERQLEELQRHNLATEGQQRTNEDGRNRRFEQGEAGKDKRAITNGSGGQKRSDINGASSAIGRFNSLTTRIQRALDNDDPELANSLLNERDSLEERMRAQYGDLLEADDKGKPTRLKVQRYTEDEVRARAQKLFPNDPKKVEKAVGEWRKLGR